MSYYYKMEKPFSLVELMNDNTCLGKGEKWANNGIVLTEKLPTKKELREMIDNYSFTKVDKLDLKEENTLRNGKDKINLDTNTLEENEIYFKKQQELINAVRLIYTIRVKEPEFYNIFLDCLGRKEKELLKKVIVV